MDGVDSTAETVADDLLKSAISDLQQYLPADQSDADSSGYLLFAQPSGRGRYIPFLVCRSEWCGSPAEAIQQWREKLLGLLVDHKPTEIVWRERPQMSKDRDSRQKVTRWAVYSRLGLV